MADFHQDRIVTTLHDLYEAFDRESYLQNLDTRLEAHAEHRNMTLLLPSLYAELENPQVLEHIIETICGVNYLHRVVVALGGAPSEDQFRHAQEYFYRLRRADRDVKIVWVDGPRVQQVLNDIGSREIPTGVQGKGQSVWLALGYIFGKDDSDVVALHDCDIVTYDRILLGRLIEPTANPNNDFEFCKGYYARISPIDRQMKGRVTRILVTPLVDSLMDIMARWNHSELMRFFRYHRAFKYPLAGEFSFTTQLGRGINVAYDWGLEVATLSQVYDQLVPRQIAQIDLATNYEHKHQELSPEDVNRGLHRMVVDIAKFFLMYMRGHAVRMDDSFVDMMIHTYYQNAISFIRRYSYDAEVNNLQYNLYEEESAARHFRAFLWSAWEQSRGPHESTLIPSWNRVCYGFPEIYEHMLDAVEADNATAVNRD